MLFTTNNYFTVFNVYRNKSGSSEKCNRVFVFKIGGTTFETSHSEQGKCTSITIKKDNLL